MKTKTTTKSATTAKIAVASLALIAGLGLNFIVNPALRSNLNSQYNAKKAQMMETIPIVTSCTDSDGGQLKYVKGVMSTTLGAKKSTFTDSCVGGSVVLEYFCDSKGAKGTKEISCGTNSRCLEGACVEPYTCVKIDDPAGKKNVYVGGYVTLRTSVQSFRVEDRCLSATKLSETICNEKDATGFATDTIDCSAINGMVCYNNACMTKKQADAAAAKKIPASNGPKTISQ